MTETNVKRLFLLLKRMMNSTENTRDKENQRNLIIVKFKPKNQLSSEVNEKSLATKKNKRTLQTIMHSGIEKKKQPKSST